MTDQADRRPIAAETTHFSVLGGEADGPTWKCWTEGSLVLWHREEPDGKVVVSGAMPRRLFLLAALTIAKVCEERVFGDDADDPCEMIHQCIDDMKMPVEYGFAHPHHGRDAENEPTPEMDLSLGYAFSITSWSPDQIGPEPGRILRDDNSQSSPPTAAEGTP